MEEKKDSKFMLKQELAGLLNETAEKVMEFDNPIFLGSLMYRTVQERESSNLLMRNINAKLDLLELINKRIEALAAAGPPATIPHPSATQRILSETDNTIMAFIKEKGKASAKDIQAQFNYKGKNAASARLNALHKLGLLQKQQAGRTVFYTPI